MRFQQITFGYTPQFYNEKSNALLWEGDVNGFSQIGTGDLGMEEKNAGSIWHTRKTEDLDQTMAQYSNSSITAYKGLDVLQHNFNNSAVVVECHKDKRSCDGAGPSGEGSSNNIAYSKRTKRITEFMALGNCDCEKASDSDQ